MRHRHKARPAGEAARTRHPRLLASAIAIAVPITVLLTASAATDAQAQAHATTSAPSAGTNIGNAGILTSAAAGTGDIVSGSTDWWVIYPARTAGVVIASVANNAPSSGAFCPITASLFGTDGTDQQLQSASLGNASTTQLAGRANGSDRYYVEVAAVPNSCTVTPYTITLDSGGGGTPPDPAKGSVPSGTSISNARPPLRGHVAYAQSLANWQSPDWYVLFKKPDAREATIRLENTSICAITVNLLDTNADNDRPVTSAEIDSDGAATLSVPAREAADPTGRYYLEVAAPDPCDEAMPYLAEPEPAAEWESPAPPKTGHVAPGKSAGSAWPPLHGGTSYAQRLANWQSPDWYVLYKRPDTSQATIRFAESGGCALDAWLYGATAAGGLGRQLNFIASSDDGAATFTVPGRESADPQGRYYVEVTSPDPCGSGGTYTVEPEPGPRWAAPALKVPVTVLRKATVHRAYTDGIAVLEGKKPYVFAARTKLPAGLRLSRAGVLAGTPARAGTYSITVTITDSSRPRKSVTVRFSITVAK